MNTQIIVLDVESIWQVDQSETLRERSCDDRRIHLVHQQIEFGHSTFRPWQLGHRGVNAIILLVDP